MITYLRFSMLSLVILRGLGTPTKEKEKHKARNSLGPDEIVRIIEGPDKREYEY